MKDIIQFYKELEENNRFISWEHCYAAFNDKTLNTDTKALHLAFYLASWGMYRGSSALLQKDYTIHIKAIEILQESKYLILQCKPEHEVDSIHIKLILDLINDLKEHYNEQFSTITSTKIYKSERKASDTLISKIILGTLACVPAYDRFFIDGLRASGVKGFGITNSALNNLFYWIEKNEDELLETQKQLNTLKVYFPIMKVVDMYFWHKGFKLQKNEN